jgi:hypothetical protein
MGSGDFDMVEPVCFQLVYLVTYIIIFFTGKFFLTNLVRTENDNTEPDPDSIRSKAKWAHLERARK